MPFCSYKAVIRRDVSDILVLEIHLIGLRAGLRCQDKPHGIQGYPGECNTSMMYLPVVVCFFCIYYVSSYVPWD
jgi:hypothetical protein